MDRCKLEYMYKNLEFEEKKKLVRLMDPNADYEFRKYMSRFLVNPETDDIDILFLIGPYHTLYYTIYEVEGETEVL